jgi:hypothetical protein
MAMSSQPSTSPLRRFAAALRDLAASRGLHRCPDCRQPFVCPMEWETAGEEHWRMQLRCGACGAWREVLVTNDEASEFDLVLDRHCAQILRAVRKLELEEMEADLETFVTALDRDLIDASDFAR